MQRRSFIQSLLAIPVVAAVAKFLPQSAQASSPLRAKRIPRWDWRTWRFRDPVQHYVERTAAEDIQVGDILTFYPEDKVRVIRNSRDDVSGLAITRARTGEIVRVLRRGEGVARYTA